VTFRADVDAEYLEVSRHRQWVLRNLSGDRDIMSSSAGDGHDAAGASGDRFGIPYRCRQPPANGAVGVLIGFGVANSSSDRCPTASDAVGAARGMILYCIASCLRSRRPRSRRCCWPVHWKVLDGGTRVIATSSVRDCYAAAHGERVSLAMMVFIAVPVVGRRSARP